MLIKHCRICGHQRLDRVLDLGKVPLVNYFQSRIAYAPAARKYPLRLCLCRQCGLAQLDETLPASQLFRRYHYLTSASAPLGEHFSGLASECVQRRFVKRGGDTLDIGANDGTLLLKFRDHGIRVLGVDPSRNAVAVARERGIQVLPDFFNLSTAAKIRKRHGPFDVITGTNVLAQTHDLRGFLRGVKMLLSPRGVFIAEFAHLLDMVVKNQFDVIYHEHLSYFSFPPLMRLFGACGLEIFDAKKILTQGGSLRVYARHQDATHTVRTRHLDDILREEKENHLNELPTLRRFAQQVRQFRKDLRALVSGIKKQGKRIVGFGAPAKGVALFHYCRLGTRQIDYIVDSTPLKQGRYFPGLGIPVHPEEKLLQDRPDYFFVLAWNFQDTVLRKLEAQRATGAKVIIPFPKLRVI